MTGQRVKLKTVDYDYWKPLVGSFDAGERYVLDGTRSSRTTATITMPSRRGIWCGWMLFWRSLWWTIRRRESIEFWMESDV